MDAIVLRVSGGDVTPEAPGLAKVDGVLAVNQVGTSLRVLVKEESVIDAVQAELPAAMHTEKVAASVEDVFVGATLEGQRA